MSARLFYADMSFKLSEREQRALFEEYGRVFSFEPVYDQGGMPRGFGFVEMDDDGAARAVTCLNRQRVGGRWLHVRFEDSQLFAGACSLPGEATHRTHRHQS